jgi:hypothetical protein
LGEVVGDGAANDAAANDDDIGSFRNGFHGHAAFGGLNPSNARSDATSNLKKVTAV